MDEIGRGTSTFDGLALAWSVATELAMQVRAMTLFATHYFELTRLADEHDGIDNVHLTAREHRDRIVFLHSVREGPANQSYGLQVARLAGLPAGVLARARSRLEQLEAGAESAASPQLSLFAGPAHRRAAHVGEGEAPAPTAAPDPVRELLDAVDPDALSPREALDLVYRLTGATKSKPDGAE
jgi:DNA mismatch repair protein MutS